jgi:hypothetical protein
MRSITWLASDEEASIMDLSPVAAKAHGIRVQKAAFSSFHFPRPQTQYEQLHGRVQQSGTPVQVEPSILKSLTS